MRRALHRRYGHSTFHMAEKRAWVKWMSARDKRDRLRSKGDPRYRRYYELADKLQHQLQDMSPYGHSLVWGYEGKRLEKQWVERHPRRK